MAATRLLVCPVTRAAIAALCLSLPTAGCGDDCGPDEDCVASATVTETSTTAPETTEGETTDSSSAGSETGSGTDDTTAGGAPYCADKDQDSFGDPDDCALVPDGQAPPSGFVDNDDDCDDASAATFPGAAPEDDADACMRDVDEDDFGDREPPKGVSAGSDCLDSDPEVHPGVDRDDPTACVVDGDGDGHGDASPPAGIDPGDDCDDGDPETFPGAAPLDDPKACLKDHDDDDFGDASPPVGVPPGTDCDDDDADTFPGAAELEDPVACMRDEDDDGYGASLAPDGVASGADCFDQLASHNPGALVLVSALEVLGEIVEVDPASGQTATYATFDPSSLNGWFPASLAMEPSTGTVYAANNAGNRLVTLDYCAGEVTALNANNLNICGIAFDREGVLYGLDNEIDVLVTFDLDTGAIVDMKPVTENGAPLNVGGCGMTFDCAGDRLIFSDAYNRAVYAITPDGKATKITGIPQQNFGRGFVYEPFKKLGLSCAGTDFIEVSLDGSNTFTSLPPLSVSLDDLEYGPVCD
ncbi:MAG: hypothetical protein R3A51_06370 [Nannocystaceae bacterium]